VSSIKKRSFPDISMSPGISLLLILISIIFALLNCVAYKIPIDLRINYRYNTMIGQYLPGAGGSVL